jgi:hypothetical protein
MAGMIVTLVTMSCNLPLGFLQSGESGGSGEDELTARELDELDISLSGDQAIIDYEQGPDEDPEVMVTGWLLAFEKAASEEPDAREITLRTTFNGEPYLEISAATADVRFLIDGVITPEEFLDVLEILDVRPLESRIFGQLVEKGLDVKDVSHPGDALVVEYYPKLAETRADLMDEWLEIMVVVIKEEAPVDTVQIRSLMLDTSVFVVEIGMADLEDFYTGELTAFDFLARLAITEEPVVLDNE